MAAVLVVVVEVVADRLIDAGPFIAGKIVGPEFISLVRQLKQWNFSDIWSIFIRSKVYYLQETDNGFIEIF